MVKHLSGKLILVASAAFVVGHQEVSGQHGFHKTPPVVNQSCAIGNCPTNFLTYGFFQENWRRWPEESAREIAAAKSSELNPFVVPDRNEFGPIIPNSRDEAVQTPRNRKPIKATAEDANVQAVEPSRVPAPTPDSSGGLMDLEGLPSETPDRATELPQTDSIPETPESNDLFGPLDDDTLEPSVPQEPAESEDEFDFESLDLSNDSQRRPQASSSQKTALQIKPMRKPPAREAEPRPLPQLAARELGQEIHHDVTRVDQVNATVEIDTNIDERRRGRNPLRVRTLRSSQRTSIVPVPSPQPTRKETRKETRKVREVKQTQAQPQRPRSNRSNPLRRR